MIDERGMWAPELVPKGYDVLNDYTRYILLDGPRQTGKTTTLVSKVCRHLWEVRDSRFAIIGKSIRSIKSSGTWQDLIYLQTGIKQWIDAGIGFCYTVEPKLTGDTKMTFLRVRNHFGGESELQIHSLEHDHQVEQKFKQTRYSGFWLVEADQFRSPDVLLALDEQLRCPWLPPEEHQVLLDCNPPEEGEDHWLYRRFVLKIGEDGEPLSEFIAKDYARYQFLIDDNPFLSEDTKQRLMEKYNHDPKKKARYVDGRWEKDTTGGIFSDIWSESTHAIGNASGPERSWDIIVPNEYSHELAVGIDAGDVNHAASFICPRAGETKTVFDVIDELVVIDRQVSLSDFTGGLVEKMDFWEKVLKSMYNPTHVVHWRFWSDTSALDRYRASGDTYDWKVIRNESGGRINLVMSDKGPGSVRRRRDLLRTLLFENRILVGANCKNHIAMFQFLKSGVSVAEPVQKASPHKHTFDSLSYALWSEAPAELDRRNDATVIRKPEIISV